MHLFVPLTESGAAGQPAVDVPAGIQPRQVSESIDTLKSRDYFGNHSGYVIILTGMLSN